MTAQAREIVKEAAVKAISTDNHRPFQITTGSHRAEPYFWLPREIDVKAPANAALLRLLEQLEAETGDLARGLAVAETLMAALVADDAASAASRIKEHAEDQLGYTLEKLAAQKDGLRQDADAAGRLWSLVSSFFRHAGAISTTYIELNIRRSNAHGQRQISDLQAPSAMDCLGRFDQRLRKARIPGRGGARLIRGLGRG